MHNPNWFQRLKSKRIKTLAGFLKTVSQGNIQKWFSSEKYGAEYNVFVPNLLINFLKIAVQRNYLIGVSIVSSGDGNPMINVNSPVITPEGESYINSQSFFSRHPVLEKIFFVALTGIVSGLVSYFASTNS